MRTAAEAAHFQVFGEEETGRSADSVAEAHIFAVYIRKAREIWRFSRKYCLDKRVSPLKGDLTRRNSTKEEEVSNK